MRTLKRNISSSNHITLKTLATHSGNEYDFFVFLLRGMIHFIYVFPQDFVLPRATSSSRSTSTRLSSSPLVKIATTKMFLKSLLPWKKQKMLWRGRGEHKTDGYHHEVPIQNQAKK